MSRVVAICGAGGALGSAIARRLSRASDTDFVLADIDQGKVADSVEALRSSGSAVVAMDADVGDQEAVDAVVEAAVDNFGALDVMINNAGVLSPSARLHNVESTDWEHCIRVNLMGAVHGTVAAVRTMRSQGNGAIINTASGAGLTAWAYAGPYGATKAAVIQLTKVAAVEYARDGIRVNCVCPGTFPSAIHEGLPEEAMKALEAKHPLGLGKPEDLVGAYAYLASEESRWTTGSTFVVDGGYSAP
jgi:NAD(P)-dependent dehydrogenase (short-subunit alcohol dehydrogenase family)